MCQLTFVNLQDPLLNKMHLTTQFIVNTEKTHRDGFGFFTDTTPHGLFKSANTPTLVSNLGEVISYHVKNTNPIMGHVRLATTTNGVKSVDKTKSHPFESKDFVLAHNGTLETEDLELMKSPEYKDLIDSAIFLEELQKTYNSLKPKDVYTALTETMKKFRGKFAFLIYCKKDKMWYIARGDLAKLHYAEVFQTYQNNSTGGSKIGFIVNTDKDDLTQALHLSTQLFNVARPGSFYYFSELKELQAKSVFQVNGLDLVRLGDITEVPLYRPAVVVYGGRSTVTEFPVQNGRNTVGWMNSIKTQYGEDAEKLHEVMTTLKVTFEELDQIMYFVFNCGLLGCEHSEIEYVLKNVVPALKKQISRQKSTLWDKITKIYPPMTAYRICNLQFPWMLNEMKILNPTWARLKRASRDNQLSSFVPVNALSEKDDDDDTYDAEFREALDLEDIEDDEDDFTGYKEI